jgi:ribose transport system substrate-binding protein
VIGEKVSSGKVIQIMGDLASVNGRDRSEAFRECMKTKYPDIKVLEIAADWQAEKAASGLEGLLTANPDVKGIYMQAGGVYLAPTLQALARKNLKFPVGDPKHIVLVSNDGIPQELDAIRKGELDATVSQPADDYAKYGMYWLKKAMAGETFKEGPTDHGSTVVETMPGILEDQLPAPVVTKENVDDDALWGNSL